MTLQEFFDLLAAHDLWVIFFFAVIPVGAFLAGVLGKDEGHLPPWNYFYAGMIYLTSVPGIFAVTLSVYFFLFERRSILETDLYVQVLPVVSMVATLLLIRRNVDLDLVPGFDKLSGLIMMITAALAIMWFVDRTRIWAITFVRFEYVLLIFIGLLVVIRLGWSRLVKG